VCVYIASSLDGFIAGEDDDLSWLPTDVDPSPSEPGALGYEQFMEGVGALLMGRRTYDVVRGFDVEWPYGERPVLVATRRPLDDDPPSTVTPVSGTIAELVGRAREIAGDAAVYLDGGDLIGQAAAADLIDEVTLTLVPVALGRGRPLFAGLTRPYPMTVLSHHSFAGGMVQLRCRPNRGSEGGRERP
jgi:dihydrofolate reductase